MMMRRAMEADAQGDLRMLYGDKIAAPGGIDEEPSLYFDGYPHEVVRLGWQLWKQNNFSYPIPDPEVLMEIDPRWLAALNLYNQGVEFQKEVVKRSLNAPNVTRMAF